MLKTDEPSLRMVEAGYEALRKLLPIELRPPYGAIDVAQLMGMATECYCAMEAARATSFLAKYFGSRK